MIPTPDPTSETQPVSVPFRPHLSVVIPAYNEARRIGRTLSRVRKYASETSTPTEIIVVNDGSTDETAAIVERALEDDVGLRILSHSPRRGKGHAVRRGMLAAQGQFALMTDADLSTPMGELDKLLPWFERGYDVVIGSRDMPESLLDPPQPLLRRWAAWGFRAVRRRMLLPAIRDTQCGFKCFTRAAAWRVFSRTVIDGFLFDCEALALAEHYGLRIREVGVVWRDDRDSRVRPLREVPRTLRDLRRIRRRLRRMGNRT